MINEEICQSWESQIIKDNPIFPFIIIDNWYNPDEEKAVWKELDFYSSIPKEQIDRSENTIVARNEDGSSKGKSFRFYPNKYYTNEGMYKSTIFNCMYKQRTPKFHKIISECMPYARSFLSSNSDNTIISYYEQSDYYDSHHDTFQWTCCIWMVREPRLFNCGDFEFSESGHKIELKNNRAVFFPSCFLHSVSPINFHIQPQEIGYGRYTITHFYNHVLN